MAGKNKDKKGKGGKKGKKGKKGDKGPEVDPVQVIKEWKKNYEENCKAQGVEPLPQLTSALTDEYVFKKILVYSDLMDVNTTLKLGPQQTRAIADSLNRYQHLKRAEFAHANVTDEGATALAGWLRHNHTMTTFALVDNGIGIQGCAALGEALSKGYNTTLLSLNLDLNPFSDNGARVLGKGLQSNKTLQSLSLEYCNISALGAECLAASLIHEKSVGEAPNDTGLKALSLRGNRLTCEGVRHMMNAMRTNKTLTKLNLADVGLSTKAGPSEFEPAKESIAAALRENRVCNEYNFDHNCIGDAAALLFTTLIGENPEVIKFRTSVQLQTPVFKGMFAVLDSNEKEWIKRNKKKKGKKGKGKGKGKKK